jgi:hypothetical protein
MDADSWEDKLNLKHSNSAEATKPTGTIASPREQTAPGEMPAGWCVFCSIPALPTLSDHRPPSRDSSEHARGEEHKLGSGGNLALH